MRLARVTAFLAVLGPGVLAGISDDDPAGITTYSILGAREGYRLLWVLAAATAALIIFHELASRMAIVTGRGLTALVREHHGTRAAWGLFCLLVVANLGTTAAELAGVAAGAELGGVPRAPAVAAAVALVATLLLRGSFKRVERVLLGVCAVFVTYIAAGILAHPDWGRAAQGLVVPSLPGSRDGMLLVVATIGTTLAPWGLTFIQSYTVDKHLLTGQLRTERLDVIIGAILTGVIGAFVVVACAATLKPRGIRVDDARQAAEALKPVAGHLAATLFAVGLVGAALLAAAILPLATAYSLCEAADRPAHLDLRSGEPLFYRTIVAMLIVAGVLVCIPGAPLIPILYLTQALNAILLMPVLWVMRSLAMDRTVMGDHALRGSDRWLTGITLVAITGCVIALLVLTLAP